MDSNMNQSKQNSFDNEIQMEITSSNDCEPNECKETAVNSRPNQGIPSVPDIVELEMVATGDDGAKEDNTLCIDKIFDRIQNTVLEHKKILKQITYSVLLLLYLSYVGYSLSFRFGDEGSWRLLICTILILLYLGRRIIKKCSVYKLFKTSLGSKNPENILKLKKIIRWVLYFVVLALIAVYIGLTVIQTRPRNLVSLVGIFVFIFILFLMSSNKANINWHTVFWGLSLQFAFALIVLRTDWGIGAVRWTTDRFLEFIVFADNGSAFIFSEQYKEFKVIFKVVPSVIVFCAFVAVLSYLGVLAFIFSNVGGFLGYCLQTHPLESINAASNIFMSGMESLVIINEYLDSLSTSQVFCVYTNGLSSIAGFAFVVFSNFGIPVEYLLTASVMSAPAALVASKIVYPSEASKDDDNKYFIATKSGRKSVVEAFAKGGMQGLQLVKGVLINILTYISLMAFVNAAVTWFGERAGVPDLTIGKIFSYCFWPLAFVMGIDATDCLKVAELLGVRMFATLILSYIRMGQYLSNKEKYNQYTALYNNTVLTSNDDIFLPSWNTTLKNGILTDRSELIATYAMCGFASIPAVWISLGSFVAMAPGRLGELPRMAVRALIAGTIASYLTACVAGLLST